MGGKTMKIEQIENIIAVQNENGTYDITIYCNVEGKRLGVYFENVQLNVFDVHDVAEDNTVYTISGFFGRKGTGQ